MIRKSVRLLKKSPNLTCSLIFPFRFNAEKESPKKKKPFKTRRLNCRKNDKHFKIKLNKLNIESSSRKNN
jgi:hypothetical protein